MEVTTITLPTYEMEPPENVPLFFRNEEVQLAEKHVYPYPFYDVQATEKVDVDYTAVLLENEFIRICVTPEMGGRLYYAIDKTNNYDIVYNNRVVKPALIGTLGAWTSGGVEWNTPHHHRATSLLPVDYTLVDHPDGSKTVWVGEYEKRCQTRWLTGMTLEPGKAYVKVNFKSMNVTPFAYPALDFANAAVHTNDDYQFIFPPDVDMANFHYVSEFTRWPVPNQVYQSTDYTHGEDLSWWKEARQPVSFFVTKTSQDFMGGIDHGKDAGIVLVGDHRIFKGKKLWNWGKNRVQEVWDTKLTDDDGPYAELMMGFYSDNQPDYNFVAPFETKYGDMYLYGIKGLDSIKEANKDFAINLEVEDGKALVQVNATAVREGVRVVLSPGRKNLLDVTIDVNPATPFEARVDVPRGTDTDNLLLSLYAPSGEELMTWRKPPVLNEPFPEPYQDPRDPSTYESAEDLYFAGLKLEQFGNTNYDYMKYYEAALARDPDHVDTNTQLGQIYLKRGEYELAGEHLRRAVGVVTGNYKKAQDATPLYYLGVCCMKQDKLDEALHYLYRSTWDYAWTSAGYTLAAQIETRFHRWDRALDAAERACRANTQNEEALLTRAILLRLRGEYGAAREVVREALNVDPLSFVAMNELRLHGEDTRLQQHLRDEPYNYIETAARYSAMGRYEEAADVMQLAADAEAPALRDYPMVWYHLAYYRAEAGGPADDVLKMAASLSTELCFPYGDESIRVLRFALDQNEDDASAWYLLGNALADRQREEAVHCWQRALAHGKDEALVYRNMAYLQANHLHDMPAALDNIMHAIRLDASEPRYFAEANLYMSYASLTPEQLAKFLDEYGSMGAEITDIQLMAIKLANFQGDYDKAIGLLENMTYHIEEGATFNPHVYWFDAHLQKGIAQMERGDHAGAEASLLRAMEFPANLEAERDGKIGIAYYYLGRNSKQAGDTEKARGYFQQLADYSYEQGWGAGDWPELEYFKALALLELGHDETEAQSRFAQLIADGEQRLIPVQDSRHITTTAEESHGGRLFLIEKELRRKGLRVSSYYMQGLGHLGLGDKAEAKAFFEKAMEVDPLAIDPKRMLETMNE